MDRKKQKPALVMMSEVLDCPFFKVFSVTNTLLLGAGALYLVAFGNEKLPPSGDKAYKRLTPKPPHTYEMNAEGIITIGLFIPLWYLG